MRRAYARYRDSGVEWLGEVPEHWDVRRLARSVRRSDQKVEPDDATAETYVGLEHVESWTGRLLPLDNELTAEGSATRFTTGDVLFGKLRPYLAKAFAPEFGGVCSGEFLVMEPVDYDRRYLLYALLSDGFVSLVDSSTYGAKMPRANWGFISATPLPLPPLDEQRGIAAFLDRETSRIDTLIEKKRLLLDRLEEQRTALISRTVTRGLPSEARAAGLDPAPRLKPSGVEWLGDVPEHWEVKPVGYLMRVLGGATPDMARAEFWEGDIPWVSPKDMKRPRISDSEDHVSEEALAKSSISMIPVGAVLVVVRGMILAHSFPVALTEAPVTTNQDMKALICGPLVQSPFAFWVFTGLARAVVALTEESAHGTRRLDTDVLRKFSIAFPSTAEQRAIAEYLDAETTRLDGIVATINEAIERLSEYRTALITAAVTGKIDVRASDDQPVASR